MLAQEQLYNGQYYDAILTAYRLLDYTNYISEVEIYSILALAGCLNGSYRFCSKAFVGLKAIPTVNVFKTNYIFIIFDCF